MALFDALHYVTLRVFDNLNWFHCTLQNVEGLYYW